MEFPTKKNTFSVIKTEVQPLRGWKGAYVLSLWVGTHSDKSMTPSGSDVHTTYRPQRG